MAMENSPQTIPVPVMVDIAEKETWSEIIEAAALVAETERIEQEDKS